MIRILREFPPGVEWISTFLVCFRRGFDADCHNLSLSDTLRRRGRIASYRVQECWRWWHLNGLNSDPIPYSKNWHGTTVNHKLGCWTPDRIYIMVFCRSYLPTSPKSCSLFHWFRGFRASVYHVGGKVAMMWYVLLELILLIDFKIHIMGI